MRCHECGGDADRDYDAYVSVCEKLDKAKEALMVLAGRPDKNGETHGAELHDTMHMSEYAEKALEELDA